MVYRCCQILGYSSFDCYIFNSSFALFRTSSVVIYLLPDLFFYCYPKVVFSYLLLLSSMLLYHVLLHLSGSI